MQYFAIYAPLISYEVTGFIRTNMPSNWIVCHTLLAAASCHCTCGNIEEGWSVPEGGEKSVKTSPSSPHPPRSFYKTSIFNTRYITFTNRKSSLRKLIQCVYIQIFSIHPTVDMSDDFCVVLCCVFERHSALSQITCQNPRYGLWTEEFENIRDTSTDNTIA